MNSSQCVPRQKYGVRVIVDVLPNHTAFDTSAVAQGLRDAVGGIDNLYHANGLVEIKTTTTVCNAPPAESEAYRRKHRKS